MNYLTLYLAFYRPTVRSVLKEYSKTSRPCYNNRLPFQRIDNIHQMSMIRCNKRLKNMKADEFYSHYFSNKTNTSS